MNYRTTAVFILALAMAGCSKTQASKPVGIAPLTGDEKFTIINSAQKVNSAQQVNEKTKEMAALGLAEKAFMDTKEYKAAIAAKDAADKARKLANETKEAKAAVAAQAASEQTNEYKAIAKAGEDRVKALRALYAARGLSETDNAICYGPAVFVPIPNLQSIPPETCKGVAENDYEFRAIKK